MNPNYFAIFDEATVIQRLLQGIDCFSINNQKKIIIKFILHLETLDKFLNVTQCLSSAGNKNTWETVLNVLWALTKMSTITQTRAK